MHQSSRTSYLNNLTTITTAIAPPHSDNGIKTRPLHIPYRRPACPHSFTNAMPLIHGHPESCE